MIFEKKVIERYKAMAFSRCDDDGTAFYFSSDDFPGLNKKAYSFKSSMGHNLQGYFYSYEKTVEGRIVVFDHGMGGGHRSYMREIEKLCRHGFLVFSYDHTGCMESGGENPHGLSQSLRDLNDCLIALKKDFPDKDFSVMGHSWGGFSSMNISAFHPDVSHVVVLSGFVSVECLVNSYFRGILRFYRGAVLDLERESNPDFFSYNGCETLSKSKSKAFLIYSEDDKLCPKIHFDILKEKLEGRENTRFLLVPRRGHNPNYTEEAIVAFKKYISEKALLVKSGRLSSDEEKKAFVASFDWHKITDQDELVWKEIFDFLDK